MRILLYLRLYYGVALIIARRKGKCLLREAGESLKKAGRQLVAWGEDSLPRFSIELFHRCYLADAEFHVGSEVYRGPMYAACADGRNLVFKLNWVARRGRGWEWHGAFDFIARNPGIPERLPSGDIWFMFDGGYAVLFLGAKKEKLRFGGISETPRIYSYF